MEQYFHGREQNCHDGEQLFLIHRYWRHSV
jgi:hypothetical protein